MIKKLLIFLAIPVVVAGLIFSFIPALISTQAGQHFFLKFVSLQLPTTLTAKNLHVSWFGPQEIEGVSMLDTQKGIDVTCKSLTVKESLLSLALNGLSLSSININELNARCEDLEAIGVAPEIITLLGNNSTLTVQSFLDEGNTGLKANLKSPFATADLNGRFEKDGSVQFLQDPFFTRQLIDSQNQESFTLRILIHAPTHPIQIKNILDSSFSGNISLLPENPPVSPPIVDADFKLELKKTNSNYHENQFIGLAIQDHNSYLKLDGKIQDKQFTLLSPLLVEIDLNTLLRQPALAKRSPLNLIQSASTPIKLRIAPEGFQVPLTKSPLKNLTVRSLVLELGEMVFKPEGHLSSLAKHFNASREHPLTARFTPAYLSANQGIATLSRLDLLLMQTYPLATWGTINLIEEQVDMILGVPAGALSKIYKLPFLNSKEMVTLPLVGPIQNPKIDTSKFELKLSSLAAKTLGGIAGKLIGSAVSLNSGSEKIPPPTSELPWANLFNSREHEGKREENEPPAKGSELKSIQRKTNSLIKKVVPFL